MLRVVPWQCAFLLECCGPMLNTANLGKCWYHWCLQSKHSLRLASLVIHSEVPFSQFHRIFLNGIFSLKCTHLYVNMRAHFCSASHECLMLLTQYQTYYEALLWGREKWNSWKDLDVFYFQYVDTILAIDGHPLNHLNHSHLLSVHFFADSPALPPHLDLFSISEQINAKGDSADFPSDMDDIRIPGVEPLPADRPGSPASSMTTEEESANESCSCEKVGRDDLLGKVHFSNFINRSKYWACFNRVWSSLHTFTVCMISS